MKFYRIGHFTSWGIKDGALKTKTIELIGKFMVGLHLRPEAIIEERMSSWLLEIYIRYLVYWNIYFGYDDYACIILKCTEFYIVNFTIELESTCFGFIFVYLIYYLVMFELNFLIWCVCHLSFHLWLTNC